MEDQAVGALAVCRYMRIHPTAFVGSEDLACGLQQLLARNVSVTIWTQCLGSVARHAHRPAFADQEGESPFFCFFIGRPETKGFMIQSIGVWLDDAYSFAV